MAIGESHENQVLPFKLMSLVVALEDQVFDTSSIIDNWKRNF